MRDGIDILEFRRAPLRSDGRALVRVVLRLRSITRRGYRDGYDQRAAEEEVKDVPDDVCWP